MKNLKPVSSCESSVIMTPVSCIKQYEAEIADLQTQINNLQTTLNSLSNTVNCNSISKTSGQFSNLTVNGNETVGGNVTITGNVTANCGCFRTRVRTPSVCGTTCIETPHLVATCGEFVCVDTDRLTTGELATTGTASVGTVQADQVCSNYGCFATGNIPNLTSQTANVSNLVTNNLKVNNDLQLATITPDRVNTPETTSAVSCTTQSYVEAECVRTLTNSSKEFDADEELQISTVDKPIYIQIPDFSTGWYRVELYNPQSNEILMSINMWNAKDTPMIQWTKMVPDTDPSINYLDIVYYDTDNHQYYLAVYGVGRIRWSSDGAVAKYAPQTFEEMPIDVGQETVLFYKVPRAAGITIMGDHTASYGLDVQGAITADMVGDRTGMSSLGFYGNSYRALQLFAERYIGSNQPAEVIGYVQYTKAHSSQNPDADTYEALEKISYDNLTGAVTLTLDDKYGQDELIVDGTVPEDDVVSTTEDALGQLFNKTYNESDEFVNGTNWFTEDWYDWFGKYTTPTGTLEKDQTPYLPWYEYGDSPSRLWVRKISADKESEEFTYVDVTNPKDVAFELVGFQTYRVDGGSYDAYNFIFAHQDTDGSWWLVDVEGGAEHWEDPTIYYSEEWSDTLPITVGFQIRTRTIDIALNEDKFNVVGEEKASV